MINAESLFYKNNIDNIRRYITRLLCVMGLLLFVYSGVFLHPSKGSVVHESSMLKLIPQE